MKIKVDLKIFLIAIFYILTRNIKIFALTFVFIFIHELGHALTGICMGLKVIKININFLGLSIEFENLGEDRRANKIIIDFAGPFTNLIMAIVFFIFQQPEIVYINIIIMAVNLLPIHPLDGGRIIKNYMLRKKNYKETMRKLEKISKVTLIIITGISSILVLYFENIAFFIFVIYLWYLFFCERRKNKIIRKAFKAIENNT